MFEFSAAYAWKEAIYTLILWMYRNTGDGRDALIVVMYLYYCQCFAKKKKIVRENK